jgi:hypothetical protein
MENEKLQEDDEASESKPFDPTGPTNEEILKMMES